MKNHLVPDGAVVLGIDGSTGSDLASEWALAEVTRTGRPLHLVHALEWLDAAPVDLRDDLDIGAQLEVERLARLAPSVTITAQTSTGTAAGALVEVSSRAEMVVVGAKGRGQLASVVLGSVSRQVTSHARCPVVVVSAREVTEVPGAEQGRVVVGLDASTQSAPALGFAFHQAQSRAAGLTAIHCWWRPPPGSYLAGTSWEDTWRDVELYEREAVGAQLREWTDKCPDVDVRHEFVRGHPVNSLVAASAGAELIVLGSRGRGGFVGLMLGSVSHGVLGKAHCPVAVVRTDQESHRPAEDDSTAR